MCSSEIFPSLLCWYGPNEKLYDNHNPKKSFNSRKHTFAPHLSNWYELEQPQESDEL